ncbi:MAG: IS110 family transposase [Candidatus Hodarchaeota archaeon]
MSDPLFEFCGCDVHKDQIEVAWLDVTGAIFRHGTYSNTPAGVKLFWKECLQLSTRKVAMESTGIYWKALYDTCPPNIDKLVFNPATIKLKTRPKTDTKDAMWIARCLRAGFLKPSNISIGRHRELKDLCRLRTKIVDEITKHKNTIQKILSEYQRVLTSFTSNMNTQLALHALEALATQRDFSTWFDHLPSKRLRNSATKHHRALKQFLTPSLPASVAFQLELALRAILERAQACTRVERQFSQALQEPTIRTPVAFISSIPGFSGVSALHLYIELGNVHRFPTKRHLVSWAGICPRVRSSGGKTSYGRITKQGNPHVRRILFQAAKASLRAKNNLLKNWYRRLARKKTGKVALVALARKLLVIAYTLLKKEEFYQENSLIGEVKIYSTAKKIVQGLTQEPIRPLIQILIEWLNVPERERKPLENLLNQMSGAIYSPKGI